MRHVKDTLAKFPHNCARIWIDHVNSCTFYRTKSCVKFIVFIEGPKKFIIMQWNLVHCKLETGQIHFNPQHAMTTNCQLILIEQTTSKAKCCHPHF